jgi:hypothetical protein
MRSLQNKQLKTNILSYENNLKRITSDYELKINKKEAQRQYFQFNNDLKVRLSGTPLPMKSSTASSTCFTSKTCLPLWN